VKNVCSAPLKKPPRLPSMGKSWREGGKEKRRFALDFLSSILSSEGGGGGKKKDGFARRVRDCRFLFEDRKKKGRSGAKGIEAKRTFFRDRGRGGKSSQGSFSYDLNKTAKGGEEEEKVACLWKLGSLLQGPRRGREKKGGGAGAKRS